MKFKTPLTIMATAALISCAVASASRPSASSLVNGAAEAAPAEVQQSPTAADLQKLEWVLAGIQDRPFKSAEHSSAVLAIRAAGVSDDRSTVPALWSLADRLSEGRARLVALEALDALWRLGEPASEFEARLDLLHAKPNIAAYAGMVLARSLLPEHLARIEAAARAAEVARLPQASALFGVARKARTAAWIAESCERAPSLQARVDAVAPFSLGSYTPYILVCTGSGESSLTTADPVTFVARARLYELSASEPSATVTALIASKMGGGPGADLVTDEAARKSMLDSLRDHAALHLAPAAKAIYVSMRPQAFDR